MIRRWMPSKSDDGMAFVEHWCDRCCRESWSRETGKGAKCPILTRSYIEDSIPEWLVDESAPVMEWRPYCTKFVERNTAGINKGGGYRRLEKVGQQVLFSK